MDSLQTILTSFTILALLILMVVFVCRYLGPHASAWFRSNREEKIGLSKSKLFNANGYMISGSDLLQLSSTGSFKRFDSIDRDYKQIGQSSLTSTPSWNIPQTDNVIPPQPLRPAPAPAPLALNFKKTSSNLNHTTPTPTPTPNTQLPFKQLSSNLLNNIVITSTITSAATGSVIDKHTKLIDNKSPIKQKSLESEKSLISTIIPRPITKRQLSTPSKIGNGISIGISNGIGTCIFINNPTTTNNIINNNYNNNYNLNNNRNNNNNNNNINEIQSEEIMMTPLKINLTHEEEETFKIIEKSLPATTSLFTATTTTNTTIPIHCTNHKNNEKLHNQSQSQSQFRTTMNNSSNTSSSTITNTNPFLNNILDYKSFSDNNLDNLSQHHYHNSNNQDYLIIDRDIKYNNKNKTPKPLKYSLPTLKSSANINTNLKANHQNQYENMKIFYQNEIDNKNPFTTDCVQLIHQPQSQSNAKQHFYSHKHYLSDDNFDLLPIMKQPPHTTDLIKQYNIFDFEPERISSILMSSSAAASPPPQATSVSTATTGTAGTAGATGIQMTMLMENQSSPSSVSSLDAPLSATSIDETLIHEYQFKNKIQFNANENATKLQEKKLYSDSSSCGGSSNETVVFDDIETMLRKHFRNRSFSETEATDSDLRKFNRNFHYNNPKFLNTNPFLDNHTHTTMIPTTTTPIPLTTNMMHKTFSENFLAKTNYSNANPNLYQHQQQQHQHQQHQTWSFGRSLSRQDSNLSLTRRNSSQNSLNDNDRGSLDCIHLQRAISCESVSSQSSVVLADLEPVIPPITGQLCVGLQYDKNSITDDGVELVVTVMEAKELIGPTTLESFDTFVRIYLVPDETGAMQTKLFKNSSSPSYNETFCFWLNKNRGRRSLWFHLYHSGTTHTLIGEAELQISDVTIARPLTTWLSLSDSRQNNAKWGELMFSLSYLPTAERLTVVVVKGRNLKLEKNGQEILIDTQSIFVKVYLLKDDKKVSKKKTSLKRKDRCPIFNESMIFSIPPYILNSLQVRLTVMSISDTEIMPIGHIIVGNNTNGKGIRHWNQMLSSLRKPVAMWHQLRKTTIHKVN